MTQALTLTLILNNGIRGIEDKQSQWKKKPKSLLLKFI